VPATTQAGEGCDDEHRVEACVTNVFDRRLPGVESREADIAMGSTELEELIEWAVCPDASLRLLFAAHELATA
jgi:hypothetical protein